MTHKLSLWNHNCYHCIFPCSDIIASPPLPKVSLISTWLPNSPSSASLRAYLIQRGPALRIFSISVSPSVHHTTPRTDQRQVIFIYRFTVRLSPHIPISFIYSLPFHHSAITRRINQLRVTSALPFHHPAVTKHSCTKSTCPWREDANAHCNLSE